MPRDLDRPVYRDQRPWFEIWFAVAIDADRARAIWIRHTLLVPENSEGRATVWAACFDVNAPVRAHKRILGLGEVRAGTGDVLVHHDDCELGRNHAKGRAGELAWQLAWTGGRTVADALPSWVPTPTHSHALAHEADATGTVTVAGESFELKGRALAMHLWGTRRVPTLQWIWAPHLEDGVLEMTAVSLQDRFSLGLSTLRVDGPRQLRGRPASAAHASGLVTATIAGPRQLVHARAWAEPEAMVGYAYRDTDGRDLMVAQSDAGSAHLEVWTRRLPGAPWRIDDERRCHGGVAVEIHQREPLPGVAYIGWDDEALPAVAAAPAAPATDATTDVDPADVAWPDIRAIAALGLTYRGHIAETGEAAEPVAACFAKHLRAVAIGGGAARVPDAGAVRDAVEEVEPGLGRELARRVPGAPAVMDYEGEVAIVALGDVDDAALAAGVAQPLGFAAANDLTARLVQVLGDGQPRRYDYWARAKSFAGFLPLAPRVWAPVGGVVAMPELVVATRVNGEPRQHASTRELIYDLAAMLRAARDLLGRPLARGDVVLTGTPAGVGARLSPLKRQIARRINDRFRRAELLVSTFATSSALLRPGDVVEVSVSTPVGRAGKVRTRLV